MSCLFLWICLPLSILGAFNIVLRSVYFINNFMSSNFVHSIWGHRYLVFMYILFACMYFHFMFSCVLKIHLNFFFIRFKSYFLMHIWPTKGRMLLCICLCLNFIFHSIFVYIWIVYLTKYLYLFELCFTVNFYLFKMQV